MAGDQAARKHGEHMATVAQAFQAFLARLELTDKELAEAKRQQEVVRESLRRHLGGVTRDILVGSYARRTAVRPLKDIDIFMQLDPTMHGAWRRQPPEQLLRTVNAALTAAYPGHNPRIQGRSVNIEFAGTEIGYDIVPAFESAPSVFEIPDRSRKQWIRTNPEIHRTMCVNANNRAGGKLNGLIKALKRWNMNTGKPLRSFHLEVMTYDAFSVAPTDHATGAWILFGVLSRRINSYCHDPAGVGPAIDDDLPSQSRQLASQRLADAERRAGEAVRAERAGDHNLAIRTWSALFGPEFRV